MRGRGSNDEPAERPLEGGISNSGLVVRVGDTVRRPQSLGSPATHALLRHLERSGFEGAPRYLGQDDQGREVLTFVEGTAVLTPPPRWALTDRALGSVARLLRRYHDAARTFDPSGHAWTYSVPDRFRSGLVSHNDANLDNVVFRNGKAVALIDFDLAAPGSRLWDVALAARLWVPLRPQDDISDDRRGRLRERLRTFVEVYGLAEEERLALPEAVLETHDWCYDIVQRGADLGRSGYERYWTSAAAARAERNRRWLAGNADLLADAMRTP